MDAIAMAIAYNSDLEVPDAPLDEIRKGTPFVRVTTQAPGNGYRIRLNAILLVRLPSGGLAAADDPKVVTVTARRGWGTDQMAEWWARKTYGRSLPVETNHLV